MCQRSRANIAGSQASCLDTTIPTEIRAFSFRSITLREPVNGLTHLAGAFLVFLAVMLLVGNLLADILLAWVDPRIRYE